MRILLAISAGLLLALSPAAAQTPVSKQDLQKARTAYKRALELEKHNPGEALAALERVSQLAPNNQEYLIARENLRQKLVQHHLQLGNELMLQHRALEAAAEFRKAFTLDPQNQFVAQRLSDALPPVAPPAGWVQSEPAEGALRPDSRRQSFHFSGDTRSAFNNVANAYGIKVTLDEGLALRSVRVNLQDADFYQAMDALTSLTHTYWLPLSAQEILVANNTSAKHKELDRMMLRSFYLPEAATPQELNDIVNIFRTIFEIRYISAAPNAKTITVRAPQQTIETASRFLEQFSAGKPAVMLDVEVFEINRQMLRAMGVDLPLQFQMFNIPAAALAALAGGNLQDLINQLIASGGINQANNTAISALLAQLQNQQNTLFKNPVATFGGGTTLFGIAIPPATAKLSLNESRLSSLEHVTLRAAQGDAATLHVGQRYPITNGTFSPVFNSPQIGQILGQNNFVAPFPSISYEDLGLSMKAKPAIHGDTDVTLELELEIKSLGGLSFNGIPVINNRAYKGAITVRNEETAVVAGMLSQAEFRTLAGMPDIGRIPVLGLAVSDDTLNRDRSELLVIITPHIISARSGSTPLIPIPQT